MLRHLARSFHRVLFLQTTTATTTTIRSTNCAIHRELTTRTLFQIEKNAANGEPDAENASTPHPTTTPSASLDAEYIVPYRADGETPTANAFIEALRTRFRLTNADVKRIMSDEVVLRSCRERSLVRTLEALCLVGVTKRSFMDYPWLLTLDKTRLDQKLALIRTMPVRDINHFVAFLRLSVPRLRKLVSGMNRESQTLPFDNRVYYISDKLQIDPYLATKYLCKRLFILEMPFEMLEQNLEHMLHYNVSPINILKDLWAFRYTPKSVELRLERAKRAKKDKIMPWMVRCPEPILQRSLKLSLDELAVLGNKTSAAEYIAERLQFTVEETKAIMAKHPQVNHVRVTKIKEVLDYLLDEAGFDRYEIAQVPRILCHALETTKQRLEELKSYGCRPSSLIIVCRSKREYEKFVKAWLKNQQRGLAAKQTREEAGTENIEPKKDAVEA